MTSATSTSTDWTCAAARGGANSPGKTLERQLHRAGNTCRSIVYNSGAMQWLGTVARTKKLITANDAEREAAELFLTNNVRGAPVEVVRLEPYAEKTTDAPLTRELLETVLVPLLAAPPERQRHGTIHVVDASRASSSDDDTWARFFAAWNEKRNLLQRFKGEVVVVLPPALALVFATDAPDVWSIRSGEYEIADRGVVLAGDGRAPEPTWRLLPLLALFGGDLIVNDWLEVFVRAGDVTRSASRESELVRRIRDGELALAMGRFADVILALDGVVADSADEQARIAITFAVALAALENSQAWPIARCRSLSPRRSSTPRRRSPTAGAAAGRGRAGRRGRR